MEPLLDQRTMLPPFARWLAIAVVVAMSVVLLVRESKEWLPTAVWIDEPYFVAPAARMATERDPNPRWFGHPGSTLIYPLAAVFAVGWGDRAWSTFERDGTALYRVARVVSIAMTALGIVLVALLGWLVANDVAGVIAAAIIASSRELVMLCASARTDGASLLFGTLTLIALFATMRHPTRRRYLLGGIALGAAVATKYYFALFGMMLLVAAIDDVRDRRRAGQPIAPVLASVALAGALAITAFLVLTPFFLFSWSTAKQDVGIELSTEAAGAHGWWATVMWYGGAGLPLLFGTPIVIACVAGAVAAVVRRRRLVVVGVVMSIVFVVAVSILHYQWTRWLFPVAPLLAIAAGDLIVAVARPVGRRRGPVLAIALMATVALVTPPIARSFTIEHPRAGTLVRRWIAESAPTKSLLVMEADGAEWVGVALPQNDHTLPRGVRVRRIPRRLAAAKRTPSHYRCDGATHLVLDWSMADVPSTRDFYRALAQPERIVFRVTRAASQIDIRVISIADLSCPEPT